MFNCILFHNFQIGLVYHRTFWKTNVIDILRLCAPSNGDQNLIADQRIFSVKYSQNGEENWTEK